MNQTQALITSSNKTPLVQIFVWIPITASALGVCVHLGTKLAVSEKLEWQDHFILISMTFSIGQTIAVAIECANGFGKFLERLTDGQVETILKAEYSASILYIASLFFAKMSIVMFIHDFTPIAAERIATKVLGIVISLWAITSILAVAFQCRSSKVWDSISGECFNQIAFWNYSAIVNIVTDASIILLITFIALHIQTTWSRKLTLICIFGTRICVIAAVSCQLFYLNQKIEDPTFDPWRTTICNQIVQCLSIITACVPYLKMFLNSLESGLLRLDDLRRRGGRATEDDRDFNRNASDSRGIKKSKTAKKISQILGFTSWGNLESQKLSEFAPGHLATQSNAVLAVDEGNLWDGQSESSQSRIITEPRTWKLDVN
ncbi:uncharacterized protein EAF02_002053 [Botrytis sinoallii]|uniref:uncharacterized protein n=1 Tax=Botrytis sinoallii TaxID=1463999 RepID=UPI0018FF8AF2|nr:uncharacterized protein EAF02_002053 [Botrytis sinoallii]KAF7889638.1 hypothetical protein EAF02_002053 [Botrytis sinoallii]